MDKNKILAAAVVAMMVAFPWMPQGGRSTVIRNGATLPATCTVGQDFFIHTTLGPHWCSATNTWLPVGEPAGFVGIVTTGSCPAGYTEVTALDGREPLGTLAANANIGTTGGADNITPAGTNTAPAFSGTMGNTASISAGTPAGTVAAPTFTGNAATLTGTIGSIAATTTPSEVTLSAAGQNTADQAHTHPAPTLTMDSYTPSGTNGAPAFTGSGLAVHLHAFTATGTVAAPAFSGTSFDNRSAFVRVIYCRKT